MESMYRLTDADAVATLTCHMPGGVTHPALPGGARGVAEFLHERMTEAGYALVALTPQAAGLPPEPPSPESPAAAMVRAFVAASLDAGYMVQVGVDEHGEPQYETTPPGQVWASSPRRDDDPVMVAMRAALDQWLARDEAVTR